jgi:hypothetical protein
MIDIRVPVRDFAGMDSFHLKKWIRTGLAPAKAEMERREALTNPHNSNGAKGVPRRRLVTYNDNTEVEYQ